MVLAVMQQQWPLLAAAAHTRLGNTQSLTSIRSPQVTTVHLVPLLLGEPCVSAAPGGFRRCHQNHHPGSLALEKGPWATTTSCCCPACCPNHLSARAASALRSPWNACEYLKRTHFCHMQRRSAGSTRSESSCLPRGQGCLHDQLSHDHFAASKWSGTLIKH